MAGQCSGVAETGNIQAESKREMLCGIDLLGRGEWRGALACFDRAIALRETLPWRDDPESAWVLAAAWLNRGDALRGPGEADLLPEAVRSFDRAVEAMGFVPLAANPAFVERLVLAWLNRGTACGEAGETGAALESFARAESLLAEWGREVTPRRRFLHAMLHVNRARVRLDAGRADEAWNDARAGLERLRALEPGEGEIAQAGVRARSVWCQALAALLDRPAGAERAGDWIAAATDAAEEALAIVKRHGLAEPWVADLVRYGAKIYRVCQPQFLREFIDEWLGSDSPLAGDEVLRKEMDDALRVARAEAEARLLLAPHDDAVARREMRILRSLAG
jgi:hypothetical protein